MAGRIEIELTSRRPDGTWTWRAAGARQPKGELDGTLLPEGSEVGTVLRAEADFLVDGIEIVSVVPPKAKRREPERLELLGSGREEPLVTTQLAPKGRSRSRSRRRDEDGRGGPRGRDESSRPRTPRPDPVPERPAPKRLRPGRRHRNAVLDDIPQEQRPVAEQVLRGGVPAVREQAHKQNEQARKENRPEIPVDQVVAMAEQLLPRLRTAEWRDRAETALRDLEELDLRDLRSVVVAADNAARDEETKALRDQLSTGLNRRVEEEQRLWVADMAANLDAGRFVRALRISSRPPKAGAPVPPELNDRLVAAVSEGLGAGTKQELYAAALDALSFAPMRAQVKPVGRPAEPSEDLLEAVRRVADKLPEIAATFGVDPKEAAGARKRRRSVRGGGKGQKPAKADQPAGSRKPKSAEAAGRGGGKAAAPKKPEKSERAETSETTQAAPDTAETAEAPETAQAAPEAAEGGEGKDAEGRTTPDPAPGS